MFKKLSHLLDPRSPDNMLENFYGKSFNRINFRMGLSLFLMFVFVIVSFSLIFITYNPPKVDSMLVKHSAETGKFDVRMVNNYKNPPYTNKTIREWSAAALVDIFKLNFLQAETQIANKEKYFTSFGWKVFEPAFRMSSLYNSVIEDQLQVSSVAIKKPILLQSFSYRGNNMWRLEANMLLIFEGAVGENIRENSKSIKVNLLVSTVDTAKNYRGIGIRQLILN